MRILSIIFLFLGVASLILVFVAGKILNHQILFPHLYYFETAKVALLFSIVFGLYHFIASKEK